jgi:hypothetical protein
MRSTRRTDADLSSKDEHEDRGPECCEGSENKQLGHPQKALGAIQQLLFALGARRIAHRRGIGLSTDEVTHSLSCFKVRNFAADSVGIHPTARLGR